MATKIRLQRGGKKNKPVYRIVVADSRQKRDGRFIEKLGTFNPNVAEENQILLNFDAALDWYMKGAEVSDTAKTILAREGVLMRKHLLVGVRKGALTQELADSKFQTWLEGKRLAGSQKDAAKAQAAADKIKADAADRIRIKKELEDAAKQAEAAAILAAEEAARPVVEAVEEVAPEISAEASEETAE